MQRCWLLPSSARRKSLAKCPPSGSPTGHTVAGRQMLPAIAEVADRPREVLRHRRQPPRAIHRRPAKRSVQNTADSPESRQTTGTVASWIGKDINDQRAPCERYEALTGRDHSNHHKASKANTARHPIRAHPGPVTGLPPNPSLRAHRAIIEAVERDGLHSPQEVKEQIKT